MRVSITALIVGLAACVPAEPARTAADPNKVAGVGAVISNTHRPDQTLSPDSGVKIVVPAFATATATGRVDTVYNKALDQRRRLLVTRAAIGEGSQPVVLRVALLDIATDKELVEIASLAERGDLSHGVTRVDTGAVVISREGIYNQLMSMKLFLDPVSKKLSREVDFDAQTGIAPVSDNDVAKTLAVPVSVVAALKYRDPVPAPGQPAIALLPQPLKDNPMPQPTFAEFAKARPERIEDGYDSTVIFEVIPGPTQTDGNRIWFGKTFYDGEGTSGIGGAGYFDTSTSKYTFLNVAGIAAWSVSTLLVDGQDLWLGLVQHPEGSDLGGGLVRYSKTSGTKKFPIDGVILRIVPWNGRLYVTTTSGVAIINGDEMTAKYAVEPDFVGKLVLVRVTP